MAGVSSSKLERKKSNCILKEGGESHTENLDRRREREHVCQGLCKYLCRVCVCVCVCVCVTVYVFVYSVHRAFLL